MIGYLTLQRLADGSLQSGRVVRDEVGQIAVFGVTPPRFNWIELQCIGGNPFEFDVPQPRSQDAFCCGTMYAPTIQHDDQRSAETFPQRFGKCDRFRCTNVVRVNLKRHAEVPPLGRERIRADHAQAVVPIPSPLYWSLTARNPRFAIHRLQPKPGFTNKCNGGTASASFS